MEPVRVIGRIDLAQQVHAALLAVGADARLATAAPGAVVKETGRDGAGIDVIANAFETCSAIKKVAPRRPVVVVTFDEEGGAVPTAEAYAALIARTSRGPDAHLPWPATGVEILEACDRAREAAAIPRPRFTWRIVLSWCAPLGILAVGSWAFAHVGETWGAGAPLVPAAIFGVFAWQSWRSRTVAGRRWRLAGGVFWVLLAGGSLATALRALLR